MPGPESEHDDLDACSASWRTRTRTHGADAVPRGACSSALSTRLPSTVATSAASPGSRRSSAVSSLIVSSTRRSLAVATFAMSSAAIGGVAHQRADGEVEGVAAARSAAST